MRLRRLCPKVTQKHWGQGLPWTGCLPQVSPRVCDATLVEIFDRIESAPRKPSLWKCLQLLEDSQPGRVKGDGGLNVLGLLDLLDLLDPT